MSKNKFQFPGKHILLVEDNIENQGIMQDMIEYLDCHIDIANDGSEAVEKWKKNKYDLVIMDIQMPKKDGYQATKEIRKLEKNHTHIPILALTASTLAFDKEKCFKSGMDDYLSKPVTIDVLGNKLEELFLKFQSKLTQ